MPQQEVPHPRHIEQPSKAPLVIKLFPNEVQRIQEQLAAYPGIQMDEVNTDSNQRPGQLIAYRFSGDRRIINRLITPSPVPPKGS